MRADTPIVENMPIPRSQRRRKRPRKMAPAAVAATFPAILAAAAVSACHASTEHLPTNQKSPVVHSIAQKSHLLRNMSRNRLAFDQSLSKYTSCVTNRAIRDIRGGGQSTSNTQPLPPPPPPPPPPLPTTTLTEVYENEIYSAEDQSWSAVSGGNGASRWTFPDGNPSPPPTSIAAPSGYVFADEWKIDVTGAGISRDELGWEYSWDNMGVGRRRRRWLRKLRVLKVEVRDAADILREQREKESAKDTEEKEEKGAQPKTAKKKVEKKKEVKPDKKVSSSATTTPKRRKRRPSPISRAIRPIRDNWNFKGYGISVVKSLIFPSAGGISVRLPLTINWDYFERHPALPSITSSASYYYSKQCPWTYCLFLNASLPMELIRFCVRRFGEYSMFISGVLWSIMLMISDAVWRVLVWPVTVLIRFATLLSDMALNDPSATGAAAKSKSKRKKNKKRKKKKATDDTVTILGQSFPKLPPHRSIVYSTSVMDRVGVSAAWRISALRGYEFRISYWHCFLPMMLSLVSVLGKAAGLVTPQEKSSKVPMKGRVGGDLTSEEDSTTATPTSKIDLWQRIATPCEEWIRRRTGALGVTWGFPIPDPPYWSASALLSLSGFYPQEVVDGFRKSVALFSLRGTKKYGNDVVENDIIPLSEARFDSSSNTLSRAELIEDDADENEVESELSESEYEEEGSSKLLAAAINDGSSSDDEVDVVSVKG